MTRGRPNPRHWTLPQRLRRERVARGLGCTGLSVAAGVGHASVSLIERGDRLPRLDTLERIANALCVSPAWLAFGLGEQVWSPGGAGLRCEGLAERARVARLALGLSVRATDRRAGSGEGVLKRIEQGGMPTPDTVEALAKALGVSPAWLAFGEGPRELVRRRSHQSPDTDYLGGGPDV